MTKAFIDDLALCRDSVEIICGRTLFAIDRRSHKHAHIHTNIQTYKQRQHPHNTTHTHNSSDCGSQYAVMRWWGLSNSCWQEGNSNDEYLPGVQTVVSVASNVAWLRRRRLGYPQLDGRTMRWSRRVRDRTWWSSDSPPSSKSRWLWGRHNAVFLFMTLFQTILLRVYTSDA